MQQAALGAILALNSSNAFCCADRPDQAAADIFSMLEYAQNEKQLHSFYTDKLTVDFRSKFTFEQFRSWDIETVNKYEIGANHGKRFSDRKIATVRVVSPTDENMKHIFGQKSNSTTYYREGYTVEVVFSTRSPYGFIRQTVVVVCHGEEWYAKSIVYEPSQF
jgi:hypothetical protein